MNRVKHIKDFEMGFPDERQTLFAALVSCLDIEEACKVLDTAFVQSWDKRKVILRKISRDMKTEIQECHQALVHRLMKVYEGLPYNKKKSCANTLGYLCDHMSEDEQDRIIRFLLESKYIGIRRVGYRKLHLHWTDSYQSLVINKFSMFKDPECTHLIIDHFPTEYLEVNSVTLQKEVQRTRYLSRLYLRVSERTPLKLEELRQIDEITFTYALVKLNKYLDDDGLFEIFERNKDDDRLGLLIWCFGQMKSWRVLKRVEKQLGEIGLKRVSRRSVEM